MNAVEWEQGMVRMLARLPVPVVITLPAEGLTCYRWRCLEASGEAASFEAALEHALCFAFYRVDETVLPPVCWLDWYPHGGVL